MADSALRNLSQQYVAGEIDTKEYRQSRKKILDDLTREDAIPAGSDAAEIKRQDRRRAPGGKIIALWAAGVLCAVALIIAALKMPPENSSEDSLPGGIAIVTIPTVPAKDEYAESFPSFVDEKVEGIASVDPQEALQPLDESDETAPWIIKADRVKQVKTTEALEPVVSFSEENIIETEKDAGIATAVDSFLLEICGKSWLESQDAERFTLQLCLVSNEENVARVMEEHLGMNLKAVHFPGEQNVWVIYALFATHEKAELNAEILAESIEQKEGSQLITRKISSHWQQQQD